MSALKYLGNFQTEWLFLTGTIIFMLVFDTVVTELPIFDFSTQSKPEIFVLFMIEVVVGVLFQFRILLIKTDANQIPMRWKIYGIKVSVKSFTIFFQICIVTILVYILLTIGTAGYYHSYLVKYVYSIACVISIILLAYLSARLVYWFKSNPDIIVLSYAVSVSIVCISLILLLVYVNLVFNFVPDIINAARTPFNSASSLFPKWSATYVIFSAISFFSMWISSVLLLRHYATKVGRLKFWVIITIPLFYLAGQFDFLYISINDMFDFMRPSLFFDVYNIASVTTRLAGAIMFGFVFWNIGNRSGSFILKKYLSLSALGIIILFISNQISNLTLLPYPAFGLFAISFMGISAYLLLTGLYYSALRVSLDSKIRVNIEKSIREDVRFLGRIGLSQMEQEVNKKVNKALKLLNKELKSQASPPIPEMETDIKEYIQKVIEEKKGLAKLDTDVSVFHPTEQPFEKTWQKWIELWWRWCYNDVSSTNPVSDSTGILGSRNQIHEHVWFLAGTFGGKIQRHCVIPEGKSLFFPVLNDIISYATDPQLKNEQALRSYAKSDLDMAKNLYVKIDGTPLLGTKIFRVQSDLFRVTLPPANLSEDGVSTDAISDGYWVFLRPIPPGEHLVEFGGEKLAFDEVVSGELVHDIPAFRVDVVYDLTVGKNSRIHI